MRFTRNHLFVGHLLSLALALGWTSTTRAQTIEIWNGAEEIRQHRPTILHSNNQAPTPANAKRAIGDYISTAKSAAERRSRLIEPGSVAPKNLSSEAFAPVNTKRRRSKTITFKSSESNLSSTPEPNLLEAVKQDEALQLSTPHSPQSQESQLNSPSSTASPIRKHQISGPDHGLNFRLSDPPTTSTAEQGPPATAIPATIPPASFPISRDSSIELHQSPAPEQASESNKRFLPGAVGYPKAGSAGLPRTDQAQGPTSPSSMQIIHPRDSQERPTPPQGFEAESRLNEFPLSPDISTDAGKHQAEQWHDPASLVQHPHAQTTVLPEVIPPVHGRLEGSNSLQLLPSQSPLHTADGYRADDVARQCYDSSSLASRGNDFENKAGDKHEMFTVFSIVALQGFAVGVVMSLLIVLLVLLLRMGGRQKQKVTQQEEKRDRARIDAPTSDESIDSLASKDSFRNDQQFAFTNETRPMSQQPERASALLHEICRQNISLRQDTSRHRRFT